MRFSQHPNALVSCWCHVKPRLISRTFALWLISFICERLLLGLSPKCNKHIHYGLGCTLIGKSLKSRRRKGRESKIPRPQYTGSLKDDLENREPRKKKHNLLIIKKVLEETNNLNLREVEVVVKDCLQDGRYASTENKTCVEDSNTLVNSVWTGQSNSSGSGVSENECDLRESAIDDKHQGISCVALEEVADLEPVQASNSSDNNCKSIVQFTVVEKVNNLRSDDTSDAGFLCVRTIVEEVVEKVENATSGKECTLVTKQNVSRRQLDRKEDDDIVISRTRKGVDLDTDCIIRGDDDGPLCSSSPLIRMDFDTLNSLRFPDDRSDSGVSSLRSGSGDERCGSRSSALSLSDEPPNSSTGQSSWTSTPSLQVATRSQLFVPAGASTAEPVRVWRDPGLLLQVREEPHVRHVHSVQHQTLLMSHPQAPATGPQPPTSAPTSLPAALYPPMAPHPLSSHPGIPSVASHPHLPPPHLLHPNFSDIIWKQQRYATVPTHLLGNQQPTHTAEDLERERAMLQERHTHNERIIRQQQHEQQHREKERLDRERQERDKMDREREKQEREREEKERQEQALQNHFEKSLRAAQQKREQQQQWNSMGSRQTQSRSSSLSEDDRKQTEMHQRERHMAAVRVNDSNHRYYGAVPPSKTKGDYPPPPAHSSRLTQGKTSDKLTSMHSSMIPKTDLSMYGYQVHTSPNAFYEPKKTELHKSTASGLVVTKTSMDNRELPNPSALINEGKSSVIVKHDAKTTLHVEPRVSIALSPSPKLRNELMSHYISASGGTGQKSIYEYRSPSQSPHHLNPHTASPHHHMEVAKSATQHHRSSGGQLSSPHHQRQSPHPNQVHPHSQQHSSPDLRYRQDMGAGAQTMIFPTAGKCGYSYMSSMHTPASSGAKSKVSSPAPHHIYGKPTAVSVVPVTRSHEPQVPLPLHKPPMGTSISSPYQQVSQYHPPAMASAPTMTTCPPPAHSSRTTSTMGMGYDRPPYSTSVLPLTSLSVKVLNQPGTSPPTPSSTPVNICRSHSSYSISPATAGIQQIQTQPLDLGIGSNKSNDNSQPTSPKRKGTPICLEGKKRRIEAPGVQQNLKNFNNNVPSNLVVQSSLSGQPQLARVSEPSPLIASAATTITTLVNTAAYRAPLPTIMNPLSGTQSPTLLTDLPDLSVTAVTVEVPRPASTDSTHSIPLVKPGTPVGVPLSSSPAPPVRNTSTPNSLSATIPNTGTSNLPPVNNSSSRTNTPNMSVSSNSTINEDAAIPPVTDEYLGTPVRIGTVTPSVMDSEKSNSPGPQKISGGTYPVRHLKKAWLQRHTGEDVEDTTGLVGSGSCVALPLNINTPSPPSIKTETPALKSMHAVGSMAVNSINKSRPFQSKSTNRKPAKETSANGHPGDSGKNGDDSSSSDPERNDRKSPPKRKTPKGTRKKGGGAPASLSKKVAEEKRKKTEKLQPPQSESGSESDKESDSAKDSDSGASTTVSGGGKKPGKEPRKRGRRPKGSKNDKGEEPRAKKPKEEPPRDPFRKPPVGQLKKTGDSFLQDGPCFEVAPKLAKCRECRWTPNQRSRNMPNIFCRFYAFRRLRYTKNNQLAIAGFSDPHKDAMEEDIKLWLPNTESPPGDLDMDTSRFLLTQVGDHFCDLLIQEKEAHEEHMSDDKVVAWKRVVQGVREMCDVCETTLFNYHWTCGKCGFVVCLDCYKSRKKGSIKTTNEPGKDRDECMWLLCTNRSSHEQEKLMLTQIIADDCILKLGKMVHEMRELWSIEQFCGCPNSKEIKPNNVECKDMVKLIMTENMNGIKKEVKEDTKGTVNGVKEESQSSLKWLADVALKAEEPISEEELETGNFSTLRELLVRPTHKANGSSRAGSPVLKNDKKKCKSEKPEADPLSIFCLDTTTKSEKEESEEKIELKHYIRRYNWQHKGRQQLPIRIMTLTESKILYPNVPHSWLCDGKLLRLSDPACKDNNKIFQDQWKRGQPVIVSDVCNTIDKDLWNPEAFARDFGDEKNDLVNCMTGNLVPNQPMRKFWEGFEEPSKRLKDERGQPMLLKLKDWPPGEDFAEMLPTRFQDLMQALPLQEYTRRSGKLNLASRLPECFVRPDLGPKMYNAYGSALHPNKGTTNLHLDVSDAVNVMVYVGVPKDGDSDEHIKEAFRAIDEAGCDILTRRRVRDKGELPGALWHIYNARDADKIRDLLNKVTVERGGRLEPHNDPIHDQSGYLDGPLRERLYKEYGVEGYAIVQCLGDAVFIPAGAPHQVRNLHNCIKVAEDFVSPENVAHCFHLTQEFRGLSDTHSNHEDKLQIKNIIYHAVKDALSTLGSIVNQRLGRRAVAVSEPDSSAEGDSA